MASALWGPTRPTGDPRDLVGTPCHAAHSTRIGREFSPSALAFGGEGVLNYTKSLREAVLG